MAIRWFSLLLLAFIDTAHAAEGVEREAAFNCVGVQNQTAFDNVPGFSDEPADAQIVIKPNSVVVGAAPSFSVQPVPILVETDVLISFARVVAHIGYSGLFNKVTGVLKLATDRDSPPTWWAEYKCVSAKKLL
jgi:hypothetical protein